MKIETIKGMAVAIASSLLKNTNHAALSASSLKPPSALLPKANLAEMAIKEQDVNPGKGRFLSPFKVQAGSATVD